VPGVPVVKTTPEVLLIRSVCRKWTKCGRQSTHSNRRRRRAPGGSQHKLVTSEQTILLGKSKGQIKHTVRCGQWDRVHPVSSGSPRLL